MILVFFSFFIPYSKNIVVSYSRNVFYSRDTRYVLQAQPSKRHLHESRDFTTVVCLCTRYWIDLHLHLNSSSHRKLSERMKDE